MQRLLWGAALTLGVLVSPTAGQDALHCEDLDPTAEGDATRAFECVSELSADLDAALARIRTLEAEAHEVPETRLVPKGAVLAFDTPDGCPEGWSHFAEAQSRAIVGASRGAFAEGFAEDEADNPLRGFKYREHGGEMLVTLTEAQMPSHTHRGHNVRIDAGQGGTNNLHPWSTSTRDQLSDKAVEPTGGEEAHNNIPPYIALYYCKKD